MRDQQRGIILWYSEVFVVSTKRTSLDSDCSSWEVVYIGKKKKKFKDYFPCTVYDFLQFIKILVIDKGHFSFMYGICVYFLKKGVALKT